MHFESFCHHRHLKGPWSTPPPRPWPGNALGPLCVCLETHRPQDVPKTKTWAWPAGAPPPHQLHTDGKWRLLYEVLRKPRRLSSSLKHWPSSALISSELSWISLLAELGSHTRRLPWLPSLTRSNPSCGHTPGPLCGLPRLPPMPSVWGSCPPRMRPDHTGSTHTPNQQGAPISSARSPPSPPSPSSPGSCYSLYPPQPPITAPHTTCLPLSSPVKVWVLVVFVFSTGTQQDSMFTGLSNSI